MADGHPAAWSAAIELGNGERVDESYAGKFESLAAAIWAKDPKLILVVGDFHYGQPINDSMNVSGGGSRITTLAGHQHILRIAKQHDGEVWFDIHIETDHPVTINRSLNGMFSFADAIEKLADGAVQSGGVQAELRLIPHAEAGG